MLLKGSGYSGCAILSTPDEHHDDNKHTQALSGATQSSSTRRLCQLYLTLCIHPTVWRYMRSSNGRSSALVLRLTPTLEASPKVDNNNEQFVRAT